MHSKDAAVGIKSKKSLKKQESDKSSDTGEYWVRDEYIIFLNYGDVPFSFDIRYVFITNAV